MEKQISAFVFKAQPNKGVEYADHVARAICHSAKKHHIPAEYVATTCYIESTFDMHSHPALGIMQITRGTYRAVYKDQGLNWRNIDDNIEMGTDYLARGYARCASARGMWCYYNGSTSRGGYVRKAIGVLHRFKLESHAQKHQ
jgi:soluble lytic murein transglycosylase-like protein